MSFKLFKDTLALSEFSNQRFLYGNFFPALFGTYLCGIFFFWIIPFTTDYLPLLFLLTLVALVMAFITHRSSRVVIYIICRVENQYKNYLKTNKITENQIKNYKYKSQSKGKESSPSFKEIEDYKRVLLADFKECYEDNFYKSSISEETEELLRHETFFLFGFWGMIWSLISGFFLLTFSRMENPIAISLFKQSYNLEEIQICLIFIVFSIIGLIIIFWERKGIQKQLLRALPLYNKPENPVIVAKHEAVKTILGEYEDKPEKDLILKQILNEITEMIYSELREKTALFRLKEILFEEKIFNEEHVEDFIDTVRDSKEFKQNIDASDAKLLRNLAIKHNFHYSKNDILTDDNKKVIFLKVSFKKLTTIPYEIFSLIQLTNLDLSNNQLAEIPAELRQLTKLGNLKLNSNELKKLPETVGQLTNLQTLDLRWNELTKLPETVGHLANLQSLDIIGNKLTDLPETIGNLNNLQYLDISFNRLMRVPETLDQLKNLEYLYLNNNQLILLPETVGQLTNLESLFLHNNQLKTLPETLGNLTNLKELYLHSNQLTTLPETLGNLTNLRELNLRDNQLTTLPETLGDLTNLKKLYLLKNKLTTLPKTLGQLTNLEELFLDNNQLISLPETLKEWITELKRKGCIIDGF